MLTMMTMEEMWRRRCFCGSCQPERTISSAPPSSLQSLASSSWLGLGVGLGLGVRVGLGVRARVGFESRLGLGLGADLDLGLVQIDPVALRRVEAWLDRVLLEVGVQGQPRRRARALANDIPVEAQQLGAPA